MYKEANPQSQLAALQQISDRSELDEQLRDRFEAVWQHPDNSLQQRKAVNRLISKVCTLPGILKSNHQDYPIALSKTWQWFSTQIKQFQPGAPSIARSLVRWLNGYLIWRIKDLSKERKAEISLDRWLDGEGSEDLKLQDVVVDSPDGPYLAVDKDGHKSLSLTLLDRHIAECKQTQVTQLSLAIEDYVNRDPQGKLRRHCWRTHLERLKKG